MNRVLRTVLAGTLLMMVIGVTRADSVRDMDSKTKKEETYTGTIEEENPGGIKIKVREGKTTVVKQVPAGAITRVIYDSVDVDKLTYNAPFNKVDRRGWRRTPRPAQASCSTRWMVSRSWTA